MKTILPAPVKATFIRVTLLTPQAAKQKVVSLAEITLTKTENDAASTEKE